MYFIHFFFALFVALVFTALFIAVFRLRSPWGIVELFAILLLASWAGGIWLVPAGPALWGTAWLPFVLVGLIAILIIAAATVPEPEESTVELIDADKRAIKRKSAKRALGAFFWVLLAILVAAIILRYIGWMSGT
ncbi:MAG: hypothetical protein M0P57_03220 [Syntrophales bacterium]|jgi:hypothetical protein|nr:hypothetical protein [Syntrophales bacterium]MDY0043673.1 hypothetical protein [Syntrophales bacterium]